MIYIATWAFEHAGVIHHARERLELDPAEAEQLLASGAVIAVEEVPDEAPAAAENESEPAEPPGGVAGEAADGGRILGRRRKPR